MTLKRSISQRLKNTVEKTKRIVSSPASTASTAFTAAARSFSNTPSPSLASSNSIITDDVSIHSAPQIRNPSLLINSESATDDNTPTLLYSSKLRPSSIRRQSSQPKQLLEFIDTSLPPQTATTLSTPTQLPSSTHASTIIDNSLETAETTFDSSLDDNIANLISNDNNINSHAQPILLPTDPIDKSIPPFTSEQLTPILLSSSLDNSLDKPIISHINSSSSCTATESSTNTTLSSTSPLVLNSLFSKNDQIYPKQIIQTHASPVFTQAHQIDHLDKHLDIRKNDQLADQMALNILHNISEESIDELSKLRDEIKMIF